MQRPAKKLRAESPLPSFAAHLNSRVLPEAARLLTSLDGIEFEPMMGQLQPIANRLGGGSQRGLLICCLEFLVLKQISGDYDAEVLSPPAVIDAVWHQLLLNPSFQQDENRRDLIPTLRRRMKL